MSVADYRKYVFPSLAKINRALAALAQVETEIEAAFMPMTKKTADPAEIPLYDEHGHAGFELRSCSTGSGCAHLVVFDEKDEPIDLCLTRNLAAELGFYLTSLGAGAKFKDLTGRH